MFHSGTQTLIDHWAALPDAGRVPARSAFEPMAMPALVPQMFIAERREDDVRFRLAGGWVERLHGEPLKDRGWLDLWRAESRSLVAASIVQAFREARPVVLAADAAPLDGVIEIVIAPLRNRSGQADRLVGLYQPVHVPDLRAENVGPLSARLAVGVGPTLRAPLILAAVGGRRIA